MLLLLAGLGCGQAPTAAPEVVDAAGYTALPVPRLARRLSLDLRGVLPALEELDAVDADPAALAALREDWLAGPELEDRVVAVLGEQWHTRVDVFDIEYIDYDLSSEAEFAFERSVGEEPLRLAARVVVDDRPWTDVVTSQTTVANPLLASIWPLTRHGDGDGWVTASYTDGRPMSGILSTNGLWWRYNTNRSNMNRRRAATIMELLLCEDILGRPVSFSTSEVSAAASGTESAVLTDPACLSCHSTLDPIAATLFGFWWVAQYSVEEETVYHAERELLGAEWLGVTPAWFGTPLGGLADLGPHVAADPRFARCAVETFAEALWRRPVGNDDFGVIDEAVSVFKAEGMRVRPLLEHLTQTPTYTAGATTRTAPERPTRLLSVDQLGTVHSALSGFTWTEDGFDQLANDDVGFRVLAGGVDGATVYRPQAEPGLTWALVVARLAEASATALVTRELVEGESAILDHVDLDTTPDDPAFTAQLRALRWRLLAQRSDQVVLDSLADLWRAVDEDAGPESAWIAVLTALFRDPAFVTY